MKYCAYQNVIMVHAQLSCQCLPVIIITLIYIRQLNPGVLPACLGTWRCAVTNQGCLCCTGDWQQQIQPWPTQDCGGCESSVWSNGYKELGGVRRTYQKQGMNLLSITERCFKVLYRCYSYIWTISYILPYKEGFLIKQHGGFEGEYQKRWYILSSNIIEGGF